MTRAAKDAPPHDRVAEQFLLGALCIAPQRLDDIATTAADFYTPAYAHIFDAIASVIRRGERPELFTIVHELGANADRLRGDVVEVLAVEASTANIAQYASTVIFHASQRRVIADGERLIADAKAGILPSSSSLNGHGAPSAGALQFVSLADLARSNDDEAPAFLIRGLWPRDAYGVISLEKKAGKSWLAGDLEISVASGTPWLGHFEIDEPGPVLAFVGEGGPRKAKRRLTAIAVAHGVDLASLPIRLCWRAPRLTSADAIESVRAELRAHPAHLVVLDPLYLATGGANASLLNEMGVVLSAIQHAAQDAGAALVVVHHNKKGVGATGADRMSGAGVAEWGRVLISGSVMSKNTEAGGRSSVLLELEVEGDEIAEHRFRLRREVWVDDPDDLRSAMHYQVEVVTAAAETPQPTSISSRLTLADGRVLDALRAVSGWLTVREIGDDLAKTGWPLKARTIQASLKALHANQLVEPYTTGGFGTAYSWRALLIEGPDVEPF